MFNLKSTKSQRFLSDLVKLSLLIVFGTAGFMLIEGWNFLDSVFMTVTTLATVGYGEVHPLTDAGKIYSVVLILVGAGVMLYVLGDMVELLFGINISWRFMNDKIVKLSNHQIICGYGRTGQEVAKVFQRDQVAFVIIEQDDGRAREAEMSGFLVLKGDASEDNTLIRAQIDKAAGIVCALPDDMQNTFIALTAKGMNEKIDVVSRAANPGSESKLRRAGVRMIISPYVICGQRLAAAITQPLVTEFLDVVMHSSGIDLRLEQLTLEDDSQLVGHTLKDANIKQTSGAMIVAVKQSGKLITNPSPELKFGVGDDLIALGAEQQLTKLAELAGNSSRTRPGGETN